MHCVRRERLRVEVYSAAASLAASAGTIEYLAATALLGSGGYALFALFAGRLVIEVADTVDDVVTLSASLARLRKSSTHFQFSIALQTAREKS